MPNITRIVKFFYTENFVCKMSFCEISHPFSRALVRNFSLVLLHRGYYMVARRYEFYFRVAKQYFTHSLRSFVKYCFCHKKIKFISSSRRVMFFLLYRQKDIDKVNRGK